MSLTGEVGPLTSGVLQLRRLVAESSAFQARVGATDEDSAYASIKTWDFEDDPVALQYARPFAAVWPGDKFDLGQVAGGSRNWLLGGGDLVLILTDIDRHPNDREASGADFAGFVDGVLLDLAAASGEDDRLAFNRLTLLDRPRRTATKDEASAGAFWIAALIISWGT